VTPLLAPDDTALRLEYAGRLSRRAATHAVVNPTDRCSLSCAHCLFSAPRQKQAGASKPDELTPAAAAHLGAFLAQAGVRQLVISGGGEPLENLPAVIALTETLATAEELVLITSGHYAQSGPAASAHLDPLLQASGSSSGSAPMPGTGLTPPATGGWPTGPPVTPATGSRSG